MPPMCSGMSGNRKVAGSDLGAAFLAKRGEVSLSKEPNPDCSLAMGDTVGSEALTVKLSDWPQVRKVANKCSLLTQCIYSRCNT